MDALKELGGLEEGFSASDLLGVSLGGCILGTMGVAARSMNIDIPGATATVTKEMANALGIDTPITVERVQIHSE